LSKYIYTARASRKNLFFPGLKILHKLFLRINYIYSIKNTAKIIVLLSVFLLIMKDYALSQKADNKIPFNTKTEKSAFPKPVGYVNDFEKILTAKEKEKLTQLIKEHEIQTSDQIAIVTIASTSPYGTMEEYTLKLSKYWNVGQTGKNNGVLIVMGKAPRSVYIKLYNGVESRLTNEESQKIIGEIMIPLFQRDKYYLGLLNGLEAIIRELKNKKN